MAIGSYKTGMMMWFPDAEAFGVVRCASDKWSVMMPDKDHPNRLSVVGFHDDRSDAIGQLESIAMRGERER